MDTNILVRAAGDEQALAGRLLQEIVSGSTCCEENNLDRVCLCGTSSRTLSSRAEMVG